MAESGGQPGNQNSTHEKRLFANAVRRAAVQQDGKALRKIVDSLFDKASEGDVSAIREVADRLDGKPAQAITGADGGPVEVTVGWLTQRDR